MSGDAPARAARRAPTGRGDPEVARRAGAAMYANDVAAQTFGIVLDEIAPGHARMHMTVRADMVNGHAICHGGIIFALADTAFAYACNSYNRTTVAASAAVDFLAPSHLNDVLTAVAEEQVRGDKLGVYDAVVTNQTGRRIALFRGRSYSLQGRIVAEEAVDITNNPRRQP